MLFYILIYLSIILLALTIQMTPSIALKRKVKGKKEINTLVFLYLAGIGLAFIMGMRDVNVGYDTRAYEKIFNMLGTKNLFEDVPVTASGFWIYRFLCKIVYMVFENYQVFLLVIASITVGGVFRFIKYTSENVFVSVILYYLTFEYLFAFNGSRQGLAISICLNAYVELEKKKYLKSFLLSIVACMIHNTSAVIFIMYPIKIIQWNYKKLFIYIICVLLGCYLFEPLLRLVFVFAPHYIRYANYIEGNVGTLFGGVPAGRKALVSIFFALVILFALIFTDKEKMQEGFSNNWTLIALIVIEIAIGILLRHNGLMLRFQLYFTIFLISGIPNFINRIRVGSKLKKISLVGIIAVMTIPFLVQIIENYGKVVPYFMGTLF